MNEMLIELGKRAKAAENSLRTISTDKKEPGPFCCCRLFG